EQPGQTKVPVSSEPLWRQYFGGDPAAAGRNLKVNGEDYTVTGGVPSRFRIWNFPAEVWLPLDSSPEQLGPEGRKKHCLRKVLARAAHSSTGVDGRGSSAGRSILTGLFWSSRVRSRSAHAARSGRRACCGAAVAGRRAAGRRMRARVAMGGCRAGSRLLWLLG